MATFTIGGQNGWGGFTRRYNAATLETIDYGYYGKLTQSTSGGYPQFAFLENGEYSVTSSGAQSGGTWLYTFSDEHVLLDYYNWRDSHFPASSLTSPLTGYNFDSLVPLPLNYSNAGISGVTMPVLISTATMQDVLGDVPLSFDFYQDSNSNWKAYNPTLGHVAGYWTLNTLGDGTLLRSTNTNYRIKSQFLAYFEVELLLNVQITTSSLSSSTIDEVKYNYTTLRLYSAYFSTPASSTPVTVY